MLLISFENKQCTQDVLLQSVSQISLKNLERQEEPLNAHLCDRLGIEEAGNISQHGVIVLLDQSKQILLGLPEGVPSLYELVNASIDSYDNLSFHVCS